ncbi:MAG: glycine--tRNA ligase subunit beta [bacterium]|nr:glycine--tRNA ligase subunit beta [bacterium]
MKTKDLVLEIGTEETPTYAVPKLIKQLTKTTREILIRESLAFEKINVYGTPRRLVVFIKSLASKTYETSKEIIGPDIKLAFDKDGYPTPSALGFAKSHQVKIEELKTIETAKGSKIAISKNIPGKETSCLLPNILSEIITSLNPPKTMRWEAKDIKFIRPIRWVFCLWEEELINFSIGDISSNIITYGHRFGNSQGIKISKIDEYFKILLKNYVILDQEERKNQILSALRKKAQDLKATLVEDYELLETVTYLTEYPVVYMGSFSREFIELPYEVLVTSLKEHQKCFSLKDKNDNLLSCFLVVSNAFSNKAKENIIHGNERVVSARLNDAQFFFNEDKKISLEKKVEKEKRIIWQDKLGTLWDKTQRIINLASFIANNIELEVIEDVKRAAFLCKVDLCTEMVKEFPNLQGIMGYYYAQADGEKEEVSLAIKEHYLPRFANDTLPQSIIGIILSIADRLDTIVGCFSIGISYTGSQDPYGLRRQAQGIINILLHSKIDLSLAELVEKNIEYWGIKKDGLKESIMSFLGERIEFIFSNKGINLDVIESVVNHFSFPNQALEICSIIEKYKNQKEFLDLAVSLKRVYNIIKENNYDYKVRENSLIEDSEKNLFKIYVNLEEKINIRLSQQKYLEVLEDLTALTQPINTFFDRVMIMVENKELRQNRLTLLYQIKNLSVKFIDFSVLVL